MIRLKLSLLSPSSATSPTWTSISSSRSRAWSCWLLPWFEGDGDMASLVAEDSDVDEVKVH
jgi:hypothetical protein